MANSGHLEKTCFYGRGFLGFFLVISMTLRMPNEQESFWLEFFSREAFIASISNTESYISPIQVGGSEDHFIQSPREIVYVVTMRDV